MNTVPALRFPEFAGEWVETKLGALMEFRNGMNADKSRYGRGYKFVNVLDVIAEAPILDENIIGKVDADSDEVARFGLKAGDIVFQRSSETREDAGQANAYIGRGDALFGGFVIRGRPTISLDAQYMAALLRTDNARKNITNLAGGSTRFNVGQETLSSVQIQLAPTLPEQKKIASFLSAVDEKLSAIEVQLTGWRSFKRGIMQALFTQAIRFKADDGSDFPDWISLRLNQSVKSISSAIAASSLHEVGLYPVYGADGVSGYLNQYAMERQYISIVKDGAGVGRIQFLPAKSSIVGTSMAIVEHSEADIRFFGYFLSQFPFKRFITGSTIPHIYFRDFGKVKLQTPSLPEQRKIADYLSALDTKIDALTERLDATREFKRGLLQKMFV